MIATIRTTGLEAPSLASTDCDREFLGRSASFAGIREIADKVAPRRCTVLVLGQTGTGKEMLARYVHRQSDRADGHFVPVDCASMTESLFESELFGHAKGAFTGAICDTLGIVRAADGGTLFLDEIGELSLTMQAKLLRFLQERRVVPVGESMGIPVNVRVIVATNRNLQEMMERGEFREDLFFRLSVVTVTLPPLHCRPDDILLLADHFLRSQAELYDEPTKRLSAEVAEVFLRYRWPGNVRELQNAVEHAHTLACGDVIGVDALPLRIQPSCHVERGGDQMTLRGAERQVITEALRRADNCKAAASRALDIDVKRLNRLIKRLGVNVECRM